MQKLTLISRGNKLVAGFNPDATSKYFLLLTIDNPMKYATIVLSAAQGKRLLAHLTQQINQETIV